MWCDCLDNPEDGQQLEQMLHMLTQGGEPFRSFVQFLARGTEPHFSAGLPDGEMDDDVEQSAALRSCNAMRVACHAFASLNTESGPEGMQILNLVCYELLGALRPRSRAVSMHIGIVLQHLLGTHDIEACNALLRHNAPFMLVRALHKNGCKELLLGLLLGVETPLPPLSANQSVKAITTAALQQVLLYIRQMGFPSFLAALLDAGETGALLRLEPESPAPKSPAIPRSWQASPCTPSRGVWPSPGGYASTPKRLATPREEASPLFSLPAPPSSPSPSTLPPFLERLAELPLAVSLPSSPQDPNNGASGAPSLGQRSPIATASQDGILGSGSASVGGVGQSSPTTSAQGSIPGGWWLSTPGGRGRRPSGAGSAGTLSPIGSSFEAEFQNDMLVLIDFLSCLLDGASRETEKIYRSRHQPDKDAEIRAGIRIQVLQSIFVETSLIPNLFKLLTCGLAQFESVALLNSVLVHAMHPHRRLEPLVEPLLAQYLPHVEQLTSLLAPSASKGQAGRGAAAPHRELRLNAYTVHEPLGALRVAVVQILAALVNLAPERTLAVLKPAIWAFLVNSFFMYRCNHIFQAACGRLFIAVIQHGCTRTQHLVLLRLKLLSGLCDAVLAEGACGDRWHDLKPQAPIQLGDDVRAEKARIAFSRKRHAGGLGGITPVVAALAQVQQAAAGAMVPQGVRSPLAPRNVIPQSPEDSHGNSQHEILISPAKPTSPAVSFVARLLANTANWALVVGAVASDVKVH